MKAVWLVRLFNCRFDPEAMSYPETLDLQACEPNNDRNAPGISER